MMHGSILFFYSKIVRFFVGGEQFEIDLEGNDLLLGFAVHTPNVCPDLSFD